MAAPLDNGAPLLHELILMLKRDNAEREAREVARDAREVARDAAREARDASRDAARDAALAAFLQGQAARDSSLLRELRALTRPGMSPYSIRKAAASGRAALDHLASAGTLTVFKAAAAGPPALSPAVCEQLLGCADEAALVRALTPSLRALRAGQQRRGSR